MLSLNRRKERYKFQSQRRLTSSTALRYSIPDLQSRSHFQCEALNLTNAINAINTMNAKNAINAINLH